MACRATQHESTRHRLQETFVELALALFGFEMGRSFERSGVIKPLARWNRLSRPRVPSNVGFDRPFLLLDPFSFTPDANRVEKPLDAPARRRTELLSEYHKQ